MERNAQLIKLLHNLPLFQGLSEEELLTISDLAKTRYYKTGVHIFMQEDPVENVYFLHEGIVKVYKTDINGKEQIVNILQPGNMFPHQGFFRKGTYPAHTIVMEDAVVTNIPIHEFEQFLIQHPNITIKIFRMLGEIIVDLQNRLEEKLLHDTYEQVILLLLRLAKNHGKSFDDDRVLLTTSFTNQELANMIGSTRETINRTLNKLKKKGLVSINDKHYLVLNSNRLKEELWS